MKPNTNSCYDKPKSCDKISKSDCSITILKDDSKCYYDGGCKKFTSCNDITTNKIEICQYYSSNCYL